MWPVELSSVIVEPVFSSAAAVETGGQALGALYSFSAGERAAAAVIGTLVVSIVVLGLLQGYGTRTVTKCRRSPVISVCIGLPSAAVGGLLLAVGYLMLDISVGTFFGIPLVVAGATVLPTTTVLGFVAIGQTIGARVGNDGLPAGVLLGSLVAGLAAVYVPVAVVAIGIAATVGTGATVRVLFGPRGANDRDERTIPPANQI